MDISLLLDPYISADLFLQGLIRGSMYALMGAGLALIFGILGVVNFAHGELFMIGSYIAVFALIQLGLPFPAVLAVTLVATFAIGMALERGLIAPLRARAGREWTLDSFVLTIGLMIILQNGALMLFSSKRHGVASVVDGAIEIGSIVLSYERIIIFAASMIVLALLGAFLKYSNFGRAIRATAQNADAARTLGIDTGRVHMVSFGIGTALAGFAGALLISIYPAYPTVGAMPGLKAFIVVILGGLGSIRGAVICAMLLGLIESYSFFILSAGWQDVLTMLLLCMVLALRPNGLFAAKGIRA
jgi:branched-chain amino acid transport system permease protein